MKRTLSVLLFILFYTLTYAQGEMDVHIRGSYTGTLPFWVIRSHNHEYQFDTLAIKRLKPDWIKKIEVLKDSTSIPEYGILAKKGAIVVTLNDLKHPLAFKKLRKYLIELTPSMK
jgi:hypothetical protein